MGDALFDDPVDPILAELWRVPGWPKDPAKDEAFVRELLRQYPTIDLVSEIRKWAAWMLDHDSKGKVRHRARFHEWCRRAVEWRPGRLGGSRARFGVTSDAADAPGAGLEWLRPTDLAVADEGGWSRPPVSGGGAGPADPVG